MTCTSMSSEVARLAQSVERWPFKPVVAGSSPAAGDAFCFLKLCATRKIPTMLSLALVHVTDEEHVK